MLSPHSNDNETVASQSMESECDDPGGALTQMCVSGRSNRSNIGISFFHHLNALEANIGSAEETKRALKSLSLSFDSNDDTFQDNFIGMEVLIVGIMDTHQNDREVQQYACSTISNITKKLAAAQLEFCKAGAVSRIVRAMKTHLKGHAAEDLQENALTAISNLIADPNNVEFLLHDDKDNKVGDVEENEVVGSIIAAMEHYSEFARIQVNGCLAIMNLASHETPNLHLKLMDNGAATAILFNAMAMHSDKSLVQESALKTIRSLCADCITNQTKFLELGVIDFVLSAMDRHQNIPGLQEAGAWIICNFSKNNYETKMLIGDNRGIDIILRSMAANRHNIGVVNWCIHSLVTLALDSHNAASCLNKTTNEQLPPAIPTIIDSMMAHENIPTIQCSGCALLLSLANLGTSNSSLNLGVNPDQTKMFIVDGGALDAINMAMFLHQNDCEVQEHACRLLYTLAIEENHPSILAAIGIDMQLVKDAGCKFPDQCKGLANKLTNLLCVEKNQN